MQNGESLTVSFEGADDRWAHGVWLAVDGLLSTSGHSSDQITLWTASASHSVPITVLAARDGKLRLHNIWDSGRGRGRESQAPTPAGCSARNCWTAGRYRCNDIGSDPDCSALALTITRS